MSDPVPLGTSSTQVVPGACVAGEPSAANSLSGVYCAEIATARSPVLLRRTTEPG